jgi:adenylate kinase family enzyme
MSTKKLSKRKVVLIAGPAGSGKTTMGRRIAEVSGWCHIPEDRVWDELPRMPHTPRTEAEKEIVQKRTVERVRTELAGGRNVALDFIVYEDPPQPILFYQNELSKLGCEIHTKVLRPSIDQILLRQAVRSNSHDTEVSLQDRRKYAEHEVRCVSSENIHPGWIVDSSAISIEDVYRYFFAAIVEPDSTVRDQ